MDNQLSNQSLQESAKKLADKTYEPADYQSNDEVSKGLATTHEQVSDDYMEGTNDGKIDEYAGTKNVAIPRTGYDKMFSEE
ncbi:YozQ family protein [Brevibacillus sp. SYSU BS000544]|uniref:YozQ family protein n=1 Tax=Brevibacillus sp. SYSU BS000544 TaxID=3416443 RepID=UPI003CE50B8F